MAISPYEEATIPVLKHAAAAPLGPDAHLRPGYLEGAVERTGYGDGGHGGW